MADQKRTFKSVLLGGIVGISGVLGLAPPVQADIYAYTDKNGVRHISNTRTDSRYKRIRSTPTYRKPTVRQVTPNIAGTQPGSEAGAITGDSASGNISLGGSGWKVLKPSKDRRAALAKLGAGNYLHWGGASGKKGKPFNINERQRRQFSRHIAQIAAKHRLDPHLIHAVISAESGFNPKAVSHAGAMGLMQLMPATAKRFGVNNPFDPVANINGGARYLRWLLNRFKNNVQLALAGYNAGEGAVEKYGNKIPPYKETQTYVGRVLRFYQHYRSGQS